MRPLLPKHAEATSVKPSPRASRDQWEAAEEPARMRFGLVVDLVEGIQSS